MHLILSHSFPMPKTGSYRDSCLAAPSSRGSWLKGFSNDMSFLFASTSC